MNEQQTEKEPLREAAVSSQPKFSKGEWYLQLGADAYTNIIRCNKGEGFETYFVASTPQYDNEEAQANAQLMAASPDLLFALQELHDLLEEKLPEWYTQGHHNTAILAIKKALTIQKKGF